MPAQQLEFSKAPRASTRTLEGRSLLKISPGQSGTAGAHLGMPPAGGADLHNCLGLHLFAILKAFHSSLPAQCLSVRLIAKHRISCRRMFYAPNARRTRRSRCIALKIPYTDAAFKRDTGLSKPSSLLLYYAMVASGQHAPSFLTDAFRKVITRPPRTGPPAEH